VYEPPGRVPVDGLEVGEGDQHQQAGDGQTDGEGQGEPHRPGDDQSQVDFLVGVGDGGEGIGGEGRQRPDFVQPLVRQGLSGQWRPDQDVANSLEHFLFSAD